MIPEFLKHSFIAAKMRMSGAHLSRKLSGSQGQKILPTDLARLARVYETIIEDLTRRIKEIREG